MRLQMQLLPGKTASQEIARLKAQNYALIIGAQQGLARAQEAAAANKQEAQDAPNEWRFEINDFPQQVRPPPLPPIHKSLACRPCTCVEHSYPKRS